MTIQQMYQKYHRGNYPLILIFDKINYAADGAIVPLFFLSIEEKKGLRNCHNLSTAIFETLHRKLIHLCLDMHWLKLYLLSGFEMPVKSRTVEIYVHFFVIQFFSFYKNFCMLIMHSWLSSGRFSLR